MPVVPAVRKLPLNVLVWVLGLTVSILIVIWTTHYRGGARFVSPDEDLIFNVHPLFMVLSLLIVNAQAILVHRTYSVTKIKKKWVHLTLQLLTSALAAIGVWAVVKFHTMRGIDNFYSLHSWLGLSTLFLFVIQFVAAFFTFLFPGGSKNTRDVLLPWHAFFGLYIFSLAVATSCTGLLEKLTFLQDHRVISRLSSESLLVNSLGVLIVAYGGSVILAVIAPGNGNDILPTVDREHA